MTMTMRGAWAVLAFMLVMLSACGGPMQTMRRGIAAGAIGLSELDGPAAEGYAAAHERHLADHETREAYDTAMAPWNDLETGMRSAHSVFFAADAALDAAAAGGDENWLGLGACVVASARRLVELAEAVGLEVPSGLRSTIEMIGALATAACPEGRP